MPRSENCLHTGHNLKYSLYLKFGFRNLIIQQIPINSGANIIQPTH